MINVIGLGYIGLPTALMLAAHGQSVIGTDLSERVVNEAFAAEGGKARRLLTMSGTPAERAMRYNGQFQLDKSEAQRRRLEIKVPTLFFAWPGDLIRIHRSDGVGNGLWRVLETAVEENHRGGSTGLILGEPDTVL